MPAYVRVRDNKTGAKWSQVDSVPQDGLTVLKSEPATDNNGDPLPDEPAESGTATATTSKKEQ